MDRTLSDRRVLITEITTFRELVFGARRQRSLIVVTFRRRTRLT